ncbi:hypothetical protein [Stenotrophomonas maltophilia]|uniref:hypothetical protein n=1 Tax=Stenotrophomonas maltophilia TaxID=40324 RepID=UPI0013DBD873|nr:hypothetical protein [Stenotrophomonas maltophilia]
MRFNQILIVDSIPAGERNTARELHQDVGLRAQVFEPAPEVLYRRVESRREFLVLLPELAAAASTTGDIPVLHIECHGNDDGLAFADGSFATWADLKGPLTSLNIATEMNLLVVVSACGGSALTYTLGLVDRAPLHGLIGPTRVVTSEELMRAYLAFYETLLRTRSARQAVDAMRLAVPDTFVYRTAQLLFQHVWDHYQATHETPEARLERGRRMAVNPPDDYVGPPVQPEVFAQLLAEKNREFFDSYRRKFFLCDLFPEHETRFTVRYEAPE